MTEEISKQKVKKYNYRYFYSKIVHVGKSKRASYDAGDVVFSKVRENFYNYKKKVKIKYLIVAIVRPPHAYKNRIGYLIKISGDYRTPTLYSNHEYHVEEAKSFERHTEFSLKRKLKDL
jgi:hypothetical protein